MKYLILITVILVASCKFPNFKKNRGGSGGGGGSVPTVDQLQDWLNKSTDDPTKICDGENTGNHVPSHKYPQIYPYGGKSWTDEYSKIVYDGLSSKEYEPLMTTPIKSDDLKELGCENYNHMSEEDKKKFWIIFFASTSKAESGFNTTLKYVEGGDIAGTVSTGLFQISKSSASNHCAKRINNGKSFDTDDLYHPETNIKCSMHIMMNQILGSPLIKNGKIVQGRPDLQGRILTGNGVGKYYWAVLDKGRNGFSKMTSWFKPHAKTQLKACSSNPLIPDDNYEKPKCDNTVMNGKRDIKGVCVTSPCSVEGDNLESSDQGEAVSR